MKLSEVPVGAEVRVSRVDSGEAGQGHRLEDFGFVPGTRVSVERRAPFGDPTVFQVRGARVALRREGADLVEVEPADGSGTSDA